MSRPIKLASLMIYNSTYGPREGEEEEKLLYYYPEKEKLHSKINNVGLCEALVQFTKNLTPGNSCEYMHTKNHRYLFLEPENNFWMVMLISNPVVEGPHGKEIREHEINDFVYHTVLKELYNRFCFLHGTFLDISENFTVDGLREKLRVFANEFLPKLELAKCDVLNFYSGLSYCQLSKSSFFGFQSFISSLQDKHKNIKHSIVLYDRHVIMSTLCEQDTQVVVKLLREKLLLDLPFSKRHKAAPGLAMMYQLHHGRFVDNLFDGTENTVFVNVQDDKKEQMNMLIYQAFSITSCYFLNHIDMTLIDFCKQLDGYIGPQLANLAKEIPAAQRSYTPGLESHVKHVYFDQGTLSVESSCHIMQGDKSVCVAPPAVMRVINDIGGTLSCSECQDSEVITKVLSEYWVALKKTNQKQLFVMVNCKNVNLISVNDDLRKASAHFDGIHFCD